MEPINLIAIIIGILLILTRIPGLLMPKKFIKLCARLLLNKRPTYYLNFGAALFIIAIILFYFVFEVFSFIQVMVVFFTIAIFIFGLLLLFMPPFIQHMAKFMLKVKPSMIASICGIIIIVGIIMVYLGFAG